MIITPHLSPNIWAGRDGNKVIAIVDHTMDGTLSSTTGWFANPASEVSAHFGIGRDGTVYQFVDTHNAAWANGIVKQPDTSVPWLVDAVAKGINPNNLTVSIEHDDGGIVPAPPITELQYQASLGLHIKLIDEFGIPVDRQHIIGHYQIDLIDKRNCPGPNFPFTRLLADLKAHYATWKDNTMPTPPKPLPPVVDPNPKSYAVGPGVIAEMKKRGDVADTNEMYFNPAANQPGLLTRSMTWGHAPSGDVHIYVAYMQPDSTWTVHCYKEI